MVPGGGGSGGGGVSKLLEGLIHDWVEGGGEFTTGRGKYGRVFLIGEISMSFQSGKGGHLRVREGVHYESH